jgi:hypothetical protein
MCLYMAKLHSKVVHFEDMNNHALLLVEIIWCKQ